MTFVYFSTFIVPLLFYLHALALLLVLLGKIGFNLAGEVRQEHLSHRTSCAEGAVKQLET